MLVMRTAPESVKIYQDSEPGKTTRYYLQYKGKRAELGAGLSDYIYTFITRDGKYILVININYKKDYLAGELFSRDTLKKESSFFSRDPNTEITGNNFPVRGKILDKSLPYIADVVYDYME